VQISDKLIAITKSTKVISVIVYYKSVIHTIVLLSLTKYNYRGPRVSQEISKIIHRKGN
jgi:hypothetical protein